MSKFIVGQSVFVVIPGDRSRSPAVTYHATVEKLGRKWGTLAPVDTKDFWRTQGEQFDIVTGALKQSVYGFRGGLYESQDVYEAWLALSNAWEKLLRDIDHKLARHFVPDGMTLEAIAAVRALLVLP